MDGIEEMSPRAQMERCKPWTEGLTACGALSGAGHLRQGQGRRLYQKTGTEAGGSGLSQGLWWSVSVFTVDKKPVSLRPQLVV
jgi:hypothetical protein